MKIFSPEDIRKYFYASAFLAIFCLVMAIVAIGESGQADLYIKTDITGVGSGGSYHQGRLGESTGFKNATTAYHYEKSQDYDTGATDQTSEFVLEGGDGSYWNFQKTWTEEDIAGANEMTISIGQIAGSYYGKNGMSITYNEADGSEEFESSLKIEADNVTIEIDVIDWNTGKPVTLEEIDRIGKYVVDQIVRLSEPIVDVKGFCESLDRDVILSEENGIYVVPKGYTVNDEKKLVRQNTTEQA